MNFLSNLNMRVHDQLSAFVCIAESVPSTPITYINEMKKKILFEYFVQRSMSIYARAALVHVHNPYQQVNERIETERDGAVNVAL